MWSGLGYYRRARMLHKAAQFVSANLGGNLPVKAEELRAAAGNWRVHGRGGCEHCARTSRWPWWMEMWSGCCAASRAGERAAERAAAQRCGARWRNWRGKLLDRARPGDSNQAMMELGAIVCTPRNPQCAACPLTTECKTRGEHKTRRRAPMTSRVVGYALVGADKQRGGQAARARHARGAAGTAARAGHR